MRIIGGQARGRRLVAPAGRETRPTSDRVREALFSLLEARFGPLAGRRVLDLYAGSGALGLEAISRGAASAVFVDHAPECQRVIRRNLEALGFLPAARLLRLEVLAALELLEREGLAFELVLADPPYAADTGALLAALTENTLLAVGGVLVLEHARDRPPPAVTASLRSIVQRTHGGTALSIFRCERG